jgi:CysZ protein
MGFLKGLKYNWRGLQMGLRTPKLLFMGLVRFAAVTIVAVVCAGLILAYHQQILAMLWAKPESMWLVWLWHLVSWMVSLLLIGVSTVVAYIITQIFFSVFIMDRMSRFTERRLTGRVEEPEALSLLTQLAFLVKQETPRAIIPLAISMLIMLAGWLTPLGPVVTVISSLAAAIFLAWDNTDLVPARRMLPFRARFAYLTKNIGFHTGFGLWFLIPVINILFLSFAPVGATLFHVGPEKTEAAGMRGRQTDR